MGNLNITLEGYSGKVAEGMIRRGFVKTKTEALRLALFEFDQKHSVVEEDEIAYGKVAKNIVNAVETGRQKVKKFNLKQLE